MHQPLECKRQIPHLGGNKIRINENHAIVLMYHTYPCGQTTHCHDIFSDDNTSCMLNVPKQPVPVIKIGESTLLNLH